MAPVCHKCNTTQKTHKCSYQNCQRYVCSNCGNNVLENEDMWGCSLEHMHRGHVLHPNNTEKVAEILRNILLNNIHNPLK